MSLRIPAELAAQFRDWPETVGGPVDAAEVAAAEAALGTPFPPAYREFLQLWGGAIVGTDAVLGLRVPAFLSTGDTCVSATLRHRATLPPALAGLVVVSTDVRGNPVGFLPGAQALTGLAADGRPLTVAESFEDWLVQLLERAKD